MRRTKSTRQKLIKKLDDLCREYIKLRDDYTCQKCGKSGTKQIHWSHVIPRSAGNRLRWDVLNSKTLCAYCHRRWWHSNPMEAMEWFKDKFPDRARYIARERVKGTKKFTEDELIELAEELEFKITQLHEIRNGEKDDMTLFRANEDDVLF